MNITTSTKKSLRLNSDKIIDLLRDLGVDIPVAPIQLNMSLVERKGGYDYILYIDWEQNYKTEEIK